MKRGLLLLIALVLLLVGCASEEKELHGFDRSADGYIDKTTGVCYRETDACFEASGAGAEFGQLLGAYGTLQICYEIPDQSASLYLTDEYGTVYYAGADEPDAALWQIDTVLVCRTIGDMDEVKNHLGSESAAIVAAVRNAWFQGEDLGSDVFLLEEIAAHYPVKMGSADHPSLYYAIELRLTADGDAYLTDKYGKQTVKIDAALAALMCGEG